MEIKAKLNYLRIAPRKVRLVADLIRGKSVSEAKNDLNFLLKRSAAPMLKLLNSAINNAKNKFNLDENNLYIKKCIVNEGYKLKRWMPRAFGRAALIRKRTSNIEITLDVIGQPDVAPLVKQVEKKKIKITEQEIKKKEGSDSKDKEELKDSKIKKVERIIGQKGIGIKRRVFQRKAV